MSSRTQGRRRKGSTRKNSAQPESLTLMTPTTKDFIRKICYKKTASVDMTNYGFITESRMGPINVYVKPLRDQIQKIVESSNKTPEENPTNQQRKCAMPSVPGIPSDPSNPFSIDSLNKTRTAKLQKKSVVFSL